MEIKEEKKQRLTWEQKVDKLRSQKERELEKIANEEMAFSAANKIVQQLLAKGQPIILTVDKGGKGMFIDNLSFGEFIEDTNILVNLLKEATYDINPKEESTDKLYFEVSIGE